jgi:hypothetical protein
MSNTNIVTWYAIIKLYSRGEEWVNRTKFDFPADENPAAIMHVLENLTWKHSDIAAAYKAWVDGGRKEWDGDEENNEPANDFAYVVKQYAEDMTKCDEVEGWWFIGEEHEVGIGTSKSAASQAFVAAASNGDGKWD